jgi:hypothetical protein
MLQRVAFRLLLSLSMLALVACAAPPAPTATPVPPTDPPLPPTTTSPSAESAVTNLPVERSTLPPTWTPELLETLTPTEVTLVPDLTSEALRFQPTLAACEAFVFNRDTTPRTFTLGQPVNLAWSAPLGAASYRVTLVDQTLAPLFVETTTATSYTLPAELFQFGGIYGWDVRPLDINGVQFCLPIGGELTMAAG